MIIPMIPQSLTKLSLISVNCFHLLWFFPPVNPDCVFLCLWSLKSMEISVILWAGLLKVLITVEYIVNINWFLCSAPVVWFNAGRGNHKSVVNVHKYCWMHSFMVNFNIHLHPLPLWIVIFLSISFPLLVCCRLGLRWALFNLLFKCILELWNFAWLIANVPSNACFHFTKHREILVSVKCIALSFIVESERLLDSGLFENLKCQASIISSHFCQDCFSFAQMCTPSSWISRVGSEDSRWAIDILQWLFWGWVGEDDLK